MSLITRLRGSPFWPMLLKEFIQMRRDRFTLAMLIAIPALELMLFGFAIRTEVRHLPTALLDESNSSASRALSTALQNTGNFDLVARVTSREDARRLIERGRVNAALIIPPDYAHDVKRGRTAHAQVLIDAADPLSSNAAIAGAQVLGAEGGSVVGAMGSGTLAARAAPLDVRVRPLYNPALRSETYIVPGIIGILLSLTLLLITSMAIVRERERGTFEQLIVTPIDKGSLMLGKIVPFVLVGYVQMTVILGLGWLLFDIPIRGSLPLLYLITLGYIVANLAIGLLISTVVRTQAQAIQLGFFFMMPTILLSGFMFPRAAMPAAARWLGNLLPLTYYLDVLRGVLLKGIGLSDLWPQTLTLLAFSAILIAVSVRRFSKTIE